MTEELEPVAAAVVNAFQGGFPVVERPFEPAAEALRDRGIEVSPSALVEQVRSLDEAGTISRFGPLVDAEEIGGTATLVAIDAPEATFEEVAEQVNAHPEVAHNYARDHPVLSMWFVVSVADPDRVPELLAEIEAETGRTTYDMPKRREFRVEAKFPIDGPLADETVDLSHLGPDVEPSDQQGLSPEEYDLVVAIQDGLPITETPYADVAAKLSADPAWVLRTVERFRREGKIRRVGVVPNHYALGYDENPMTVWDVPDEAVGEVGPAVAEFDFVTHCYERPRHGDVWPYNVFAMTHGRTEAEAETRVERVRDRMADHWDVGSEDWDRLVSTEILKKTGIRLADRAEANVVDAPADAAGDDA